MTPTLDLAYFAKNRLEFTKESLRTLRANTDWSRVTKFVIYDDGSVDGTLEFLQAQAIELGAELRQTSFGSGLDARSDFIRRSTSDLLATVDNDAMYPPNWLDAALGVMQRNLLLPMLCLENAWNLHGPLPHTYIPKPAGDGLYIARHSMFPDNNDLPVSRDTYLGLDDWIAAHHLTIGWIKPSIPVFVLDRLPFEPWHSLSESYKAQGWQRGVGGMRMYTMDDAHLWSWCKWTSRLSALAIMPVKDEIEILQWAVRHLVSQGISVYIIDNWSTDGSYELLPHLPLAGYERFPATGPEPDYSCRRIHHRIDEIAAASSADWCMLHDTDEIRRSATPGETLVQLMERVGATGHNAIGFTPFCFQPTDNLYTGASSPEYNFRWFDPTHIDNSNSHVKAWRNQHKLIGLDRWEAGGGHHPVFPGMRVYSGGAWLKHYPIRSQQQGELKISKRVPRFNAVERARGWHVQYKGMEPPHNFIRDKSELTLWPDPMLPYNAPNITLLTMSRYADIFLPLAESIEKYGIETGISEKVLVLDSAADVSAYDLTSLRDRGWKILYGQAPFNFSRNVNLGLQASNPSHDVLFLGDDGRFLQPSSIERLRTAAYSDPAIGILSPQISGGLVGHVIQRATTRVEDSGRVSNTFSVSGRRNPQAAAPVVRNGLLYSEDHLCFVCVYIKRSTIDRVGLMDERFTGYGSDDVDYCKRTRAAGLRLAVTPSVQINHGHQNTPATATFIRAMGSDQARERSMCEMGKILADKYTVKLTVLPSSYSSGGITLITPTGGRPEAFAILEHCIRNQTYTGNLQWLCVDDVDPATCFTMNQTVIRPYPLWVPGGHDTQRRNMLAVLPLIQYDKILIVEDDDHLSSNYLQEMQMRLNTSAIVGQPDAMYYDVAHRAYYQCPNHRHASLCQTGIRSSLLPDLQWACEQAAIDCIDMEIWGRVTNSRGLFGGPPLCIGIKGMPGRAGIGVGHRPGLAYRPDPELAMLRTLIGEDADLYAKYAANGSYVPIPSTPTLTRSVSSPVSAISRSRQPNQRRVFMTNVHR